jgi:predicted RNA polymerase sigma factor
MLAGLGRREEAADEFGRALELVAGEAERRHLERRLAAITL